MAPVDTLLDILEGESTRFVWLPAVTCGYLSTISAYRLDFLMMIASIVGARFLVDGVKITNEKEGSRTKFQFDGAQHRLVEIILYGYGIACMFSLFRLSEVFSYERPIIVALSGIWVGFILIMIMEWAIDIESAVVDES